jgi:hypothetical protein
LSVCMLYCPVCGEALQDAAAPNGGVHKPWKRLSGVRFSWTMITICWNAVICASARHGADNNNKKKLTINFMRLAVRWYLYAPDNAIVTDQSPVDNDLMRKAEPWIW